MPNQPYFPDKDGDQLIWFKNLLPKFGSYATPLEITITQVTAITNDLNYLIWIWEFWIPTWRSYGESATAYRETVATGTGTTAALPPIPPTFGPPAEEPPEVLPGALTRLFKNIARWKTAAGYNDDIGHDLGIIGPEVSAGPSVPDAKGKVVGGVPQLTFVKAGHKGVYIESRRQGEPDWSFLAIDTDKPYIDTRELKVPGQPEWREYRLKFWDGAPGVPAGDWCDVIRLTAGE